MTIARKCPLKKYDTLVDAGAARGNLAVQVASAHGRLTGVGFDLPAAGPDSMVVGVT